MQRPRSYRVHPSLMEWAEIIAQKKGVNKTQAGRIIAEEHREFYHKLQEIRNKEIEQGTMKINIDMNLGQKKLKRFRI